MPNPTTTRTRTPLSFLLFLLPTSLLLAYHNTLSLFCLSSTNHTPPTSSFSQPNPIHILALQHDQTPLVTLNPKSRHILRLHLSQLQSNNKTHQPNSSRSHRLRRRLKFLHPNPQSIHFSSRVTLFFNSSCSHRFYMTWISSLDSFTHRDLFSIQTLFKSHPNACLLIVSHTLDSARGRHFLQPLSTRGFRVAALSPDYAYLFNRTPAALWFNRLRNGELRPGEVPIGQNLSNLLRLVLLYKYGGIYIDTDVIVMRSFLTLRNAIGAQAVDARTGDWTRLNNAVLVFDKNHPLLYSFIEEFSKTFDGSKWGHNGPYLVSRVVSRLRGKPGFEFTVLPPPAFYPVDWNRISWLFRGPKGDVNSKWVSTKLRWTLEESFALHLWNRQSRRLEVEAGSIVERIMKECCVLCNSSLSAL